MNEIRLEIERRKIEEAGSQKKDITSCVLREEPELPKPFSELSSLHRFIVLFAMLIIVVFKSQKNNGTQVLRTGN